MASNRIGSKQVTSSKFLFREKSFLKMGLSEFVFFLFREPTLENQNLSIKNNFANHP